MPLLAWVLLWGTRTPAFTQAGGGKELVTSSIRGELQASQRDEMYRQEF